jgi:uncharacterized protein
MHRSEGACFHCGGAHWTHDHAQAALVERSAKVDAFLGDTQVEPGRRGTWMQTFMGNKFWPLDPRANEIFIEDIAHGLAMTCRYGGQCRRFYSVAEHAYLVSTLVPAKYARHALLHDSAEAYIGDMIRPLKHQPEMGEFRRAESVIESAVAEAFGLDWTPDAIAAVKEFDDRILVDEIQSLMADPPAYMTGRLAEVEPAGAFIGGWSPDSAEWHFLRRFAQLFGEG